jgi:aspartate dehydrogenase
MKIGIVGCGAIGSEIALAVTKGQISGYTLIGVHDADQNKVRQLLLKIGANVSCLEIDDLVSAADIILEATTKSFMPILVKKVLDAGKSILAMSVGGIVDQPDLLDTISLPVRFAASTASWQHANPELIAFK